MEEALVYAVGVAVSPVAVVTVSLILSSKGVSAAAVSFAAGWIAGVAGATLAFTLVVQGLDVTDTDPTWIGVADLVVGGAFLVLAALLILRRSRPTRSASWLDAVDRVSPTRSATLGAVLSGANPKVFALCLGAALALARSGANLPATVATIGLFVAIGAVGVVLPIAAHAGFPSRSEAGLASLRGWLARRERVVLVVLGVVIGLLFVRDGLETL